MIRGESVLFLAKPLRGTSRKLVSVDAVGSVDSGPDTPHLCVVEVPNSKTLASLSLNER